jgi:hypothetical protein
MRRQFGVPLCTRTGRPDGSPPDSTHSVRPSGVTTFDVDVLTPGKLRPSKEPRTQSCATNRQPTRTTPTWRLPIRAQERASSRHHRAAVGTTLSAAVDDVPPGNLYARAEFACLAATAVEGRSGSRLGSLCCSGRRPTIAGGETGCICRDSIGVTCKSMMWPEVGSLRTSA